MGSTSWEQSLPAWARSTLVAVLGMATVLMLMVGTVYAANGAPPTAAERAAREACGVDSSASAGCGTIFTVPDPQVLTAVAPPPQLPSVPTATVPGVPLPDGQATLAPDQSFVFPPDQVEPVDPAGGGQGADDPGCTAAQLHVTLETDAASYQPGAFVRLSLLVENTSGTACTLDSSLTVGDYRVRNATGAVVWHACNGSPFSSSADQPCSSFSQTSTLAAHSAVSEEQPWDQEQDGSSTQAPAGRYTATVMVGAVSAQAAFTINA